MEKSKIRSEILAFFAESDVFEKYKQYSDEGKMGVYLKCSRGKPLIY